MVKLLLEKGADLNLPNGQGVNALMIACWQANSPIVETLLLKEPKMDAVDIEGQTAVMYCVEGGSEDILKQVLFNGESRVTTKSKTGATALGIALAQVGADGRNAPQGREDRGADA